MVNPHLCMSRLQIKFFIQGHIHFLKILLSSSSLSNYLPLLDFFCSLKFLIIVGTIWLASWCHTGANQESILQLHESLPSRPKWWQSRDHKLLHVHKWGLCGGFPSDIKCFKIERECDLNLLLWLYYKWTIAVQVLSDPVQRMVYDEIHGYALTAVNPFVDDSSPKDHAFVDEFSCIGMSGQWNSSF